MSASSGLRTATDAVCSVGARAGLQIDVNGARQRRAVGVAFDFRGDGSQEALADDGWDLTQRLDRVPRIAEGKHGPYAIRCWTRQEVLTALAGLGTGS